MAINAHWCAFKSNGRHLYFLYMINTEISLVWYHAWFYVEQLKVARTVRRSRGNTAVSL